MAENNKQVATIREYMYAPQVQAKLKETFTSQRLMDNFVQSVIALAGSDELLAVAEPRSVFNACLTAASLNLPINKSLGIAHIIGYKNNRKGGIVEAQFQIGYKGFIQLAQRTGQYRSINATAVYEGQIVNEDPLAGNTYDWKAKKSEEVIGYVSRFTLTSGFVSDYYMSIDEIKQHAERYSQSYKRNYGPWVENFDAMALKTVIKLNISKWGPQSTELSRAIEVDQAVINETPEYIDHELDNVNATEEQKRAIIEANAEQIKASAEKIEKASEGEIVTEDTPEDLPDPEPIVRAKSQEKPKVNVKEEAAKRWGNKAKKSDEANIRQAGLLDGNDPSDTAGK